MAFVHPISNAGLRVLRGAAHWQRCALVKTALVGDIVALAREPDHAPQSDATMPDALGNFAGGYAGLAFDRRCRLFHASPETGSIEHVLWGETTALGVHARAPHPFPITAAGTEVDGSMTGELPQRPVALATDAADHLYIADPVAGCVWIVDTWQQEVARKVVLDDVPIDVASCDGKVFVLLGDGSTWQVAACDNPLRTTWRAIEGAERLCVSAAANGGPLAWVVVRAGRFDAEVFSLRSGGSFAAPYTTAIVSEPEDGERHVMLTLARRPGEEFLRYRVRGDKQPREANLVAPHYDGRGATLAPDGRIAYWTAKGLRHTAPARTHYEPSGHVFGFALDSGEDHSRWGCLRVEACIPTGTDIRFYAFSRDDLEIADPIQHLGVSGEAPLVSHHAWTTFAGEPQQLYRDHTQRPLTVAPSDGFAFYEAPLIVAPGRYLWLVFELTGTRTKSPRLRSVSAEYPGHALLSKLPRTLWREPATHDFLYRYLMPIAAMLDEWEAVSSTRHRLLDARVAPKAALPWLAGFVGLVLDPCWPELAQRRLILEAASLFRTRGTLHSLQRMIELLTEAEVVVIEHFRLRGGGVVGNPEVNSSQAVLGVGYRVGGKIGEVESTTIASAAPVDFDDFAHRFTVTVVAALSDAQLTCVRRLVEHHKPAHTDFTLCTSATSMRAGVGAHVGISTVIGKAAGFDHAIVGDAALGTSSLLGRPALEREAE